MKMTVRSPVRASEPGTIRGPDPRGLGRFATPLLLLAGSVLACGGGSSPTEPAPPAAVPAVAGSYEGAGAVVVTPGDSCTASFYGGSDGLTRGDVRQGGATLDLDLAVVTPADTSYAPLVCFYDGTVNVGGSFSASFRSCFAPHGGLDRGETDLRFDITCDGNETFTATPIGGSYSGTFSGSTLQATATVDILVTSDQGISPDQTLRVSRAVTLTRR